MQEDSFFVKHSHSITIVSIASIIFCILLIIIVAIVKYLNQKTYLTVQFAPASAHLELHDQGLSLTNGTYELPSGTYTGTLTADGFQPKNVTVNIAPHQVNPLTDYLTHSSEGLAYFEKSAADMATLHQIANQNHYTDSELSAFLETYDHKASLYDLLPLTISWLKHPDDTPIYNLKITNASNHSKCQGTLCLLATGPNFNQAELANSLAERGYNVNDYEVFYEYSAI